MPKGCAKCGGPMPVQTGRGRRRVKCEKCAPSRTKKASPRPTPVNEGERRGLLHAVRMELRAARSEDSAAGQAALLLAERVEFGENSGSAVAAMVRQMHESLTLATAGAEEPDAADPVLMFRERLRRA